MKISLNHTRNFVIYGAGYRGRIACNFLKERGQRVLFFLDRQAVSLKEYDGIPIYSPNKKELHDYNLSEMIIYIAVANCFEHKNIVQSCLLPLGFRYIIYKREILRGEDLYIVNKIYDLIQDKLPFEEYSVPRATLEDSDQMCDCSFISKKGKIYNVFIPVDIISCNFLYPIYVTLKLFEYFRNGKSFGFSDYIKFTKLDTIITRSNKFKSRYLEKGRLYLKPEDLQYIKEKTDDLPDIHRILSSRQNLYERHTEVINYGDDHFLKHTTLIEDPLYRGAFYPSDGLHRLAFQMHYGKRFVPYSICENLYQEWLNNDLLKSVLTYFRHHKLHSSLTPIPHPYFLRFPSRFENTYKTRLESIREFLCFQGYSVAGKRVLDLAAGIGHFAQGFWRMDALVHALPSPHEDLMKLLNKLLHCDGINILTKEVAETQQFDVVLCLDLENQGEPDLDLCCCLASQVNDMLFLDAPHNMDTAPLQAKGFRTRVLLRQTSREGYLFNLYAFIR